MRKGLTAEDLRAQAEKARSQQPKSDQHERIHRLTQQLADNTIVALEAMAMRSADNGSMKLETILPDSVRDETTQTSFIVDIGSSVSNYFRSKGFKVAFRTDHERLDDGTGANTTAIQKVILSWEA